MKEFKCTITNYVMCPHPPTHSPTLTVRQRRDVLLFDALLCHCHFRLYLMPVTGRPSLFQNHTQNLSILLENVSPSVFCTMSTQWQSSKQLQVFHLFLLNRTHAGAALNIAHPRFSSAQSPSHNHCYSYTCKTQLIEV